MKLTFVFTAFAGALTLAIPVFAQLPGSLPAGPNAMSGPGSMLKGAMPSGCQGMLDKASPMMSGLQGGNIKTTAMSELSKAQSSLSAGNEADCMTHAHKLMGMLH
jgi:hypothetical protein